MKAIFTGIPAYVEQDLLECGYTVDEITELVNHEGEECECDIDCLVDEDDFESNYYRLKFEDGFEFSNLSGMYLEQL